MQSTIKMAERQSGRGSAGCGFLKALFLVKWVAQFKATPRNVAILLIDRPEIDIRSSREGCARGA
jgi:hypothetical protein